MDSIGTGLRDPRDGNDSIMIPSGRDTDGLKLKLPRLWPLKEMCV